MPFELLPDPGYERLFSRGPVSPEIVLATKRDRALILATMHREPVTVEGRPYFPIATMVRCSEEGWWFWARHGERLGLVAFLPWWAQAALSVASTWRRVAGWFS